jgi:hypothetical protein
MTKFSKKIFHRLSQIPFGIVIHTSRDSNDYFFVGVRDRRKGNECVVYTVPNNVSPKNLNIKAFQRAEFDLLWAFLLKNNELRTRDLEVLTPELKKEGDCCFAAFYGMINEIYPDEFIKTHGLIYKK